MFEIRQVSIGYVVARAKFAHVQRECRGIPQVLDVIVDEVCCSRLSIKHCGAWAAIGSSIEDLLRERRIDFEAIFPAGDRYAVLAPVCGHTKPQREIVGSENLLRELLAAGHVGFSPEGEFYYSGRMRDAIETVDVLFTTFMKSRYAPEELYSPPAIGLQELTRLSDLEHANRELLVASHLDGAHLRNAKLSPCTATWALPSAPCLKLYLRHGGSRIDRDLTYTTRGLCFRNERNARFAFERLEAFQQREIVFIGAREFVLENATGVLQAFAGFCEQLGLECQPVVANDPFFINPLRKIAYDIDDVIKTEFRAPTAADGKDLSVASLDYHGSFFGQRCAIWLAGGENPAYSACFGVGLERVVWTLLCQNGIAELEQFSNELQREAPAKTV